MSAIIRPVTAGLSHDRGNDSLLDQIGLLHQIHIKPRADMPGDVAVERPHPWVVGVVLKDEITRTRLENLHVASLRILAMRDGTVPCSLSLGEYEKVVAVKVHGVRGRTLILDDDANAAVAAKVIDVPLGVVGV